VITPQEAVPHVGFLLHGRQNVEQANQRSFSSWFEVRFGVAHLANLALKHSLREDPIGCYAYERMKISDQALDEFIEIYKEETGETVNRIEATAMVHRVLALFQLIARKLPDGATSASTPPVDGDRYRAS
jgi:hypothetical protein